jgi:predicted dehydrogenase
VTQEKASAGARERSSRGSVTSAVGVAVIGAGYWGPNLARNFLQCPATDLLWVCDADIERARHTVGPRSMVEATDDLARVLDDPAVEAVAIATPVNTHTPIAIAALEAGRHVLVEKPLGGSVAEGEKIVEVADARGLTLMCNHTFCYTPAVRRIRELVAAGELGEIHYVDSVRINLGLIQSDIDVFWDLGPHDLSILDFVLPAHQQPLAVSAHGADPIGAGRACVGYLTMPLPGGALAAVHLNWLSPTKMRRFVIGGSRRMLVWDDLSPTQRISVYDKGVDTVDEPLDGDQRRAKMVSYRSGDMVSPALAETEALQNVVTEFATAIRERRVPLTDGHAGLRVLRLLAAASRSLDAGGALVAPGDPLRW